MSEPPIIVGKRFWAFRLDELIDHYAFAIEQYVGSIKDVKALADFVIRSISYPFNLGVPDDTHVFNCFHGTQKWCQRIDLDYWQTGSETAVIKVGDCEDSSVLFVTAARRIGLANHEVYEVLGYVTDLQGSLLGGHGWAYAKMNGEFRLVESTLDEPPAEYPIVQNIEDDVVIGDVVYVPEVLFNDIEYIEIRPLQQGLAMGKKRENFDKYKALEDAWQLPIKPLQRARKSTLAKLRLKVRRKGYILK